jgi:hypothetical protein
MVASLRGLPERQRWLRCCRGRSLSLAVLMFQCNCTLSLVLCAWKKSVASRGSVGSATYPRRHWCERTRRYRVTVLTSSKHEAQTSKMRPVCCFQHVQYQLLTRSAAATCVASNGNFSNRGEPAVFYVTFDRLFRNEEACTD